MTRRAESDEWESGDIIIGQISGIDSEGRGIIGRFGSLLRVEGDVEVGDDVTAEVISTEDECVLAKSLYHTTTDFNPGEYVFGRINKLDSQARGILGGASTPIRITGDVSKGEYVTAEVLSADEECIVAEPTEQPESERINAWIQLSDDPESKVGWYPRYPLDTLRSGPVLYHCNLFERTAPSDGLSVTPGDPPWLWQKFHSIVGLTLGFGMILIALYILAKILGGTVVSVWGPLIVQSPIFLVIFLMVLGVTYAGWYIFEYLIWLAGAILGFTLGIGAGGFLSARLGLTAGQGLLLTWVTAAILASILGGLFLALHRLAIMFSAFVSVAAPLALILSGGAIIGGNVGLTSFWLAIPLLIAIVLGIGAAILTWVVYKIALILTTSFLGAAFLVYIPQLAQSGEIGFSIQFALVFLSGAVIQSFFALGDVEN